MVKHFFHAIASASTARWFGGTIALLGMLQRRFAYDREVAVRTAPVIFLWSERYQLALAGVVVVPLAIACPRRRRLVALLPAVVAAAIAIISATVVTPRIDQLRQVGESGTQAFRSLRAVSMSLHLTQIVALLIVVVAHAWPTVVRAQRVHVLPTGVSI